MSKKTFISTILKGFPSLEAFLLKLKRRYFLPKGSFKKNDAGFLEPSSSLYAPTLIDFYKEIIPLYKPTCHRNAKKCLRKALEKRKNYTPEDSRFFQLFIDISALVELDFGTGIQRVVRNILSEFLAHPPNNYRIQPVYANRDAIYRHTDSHHPIDVFPGDIFLGLDLSARWTNRYWETFDLIKAYGGKLYFIIYDILPVQYPQFFSFKLKKVFKTWLKQICTQADGVVCISKAVANELQDWLQKNSPSRQKDLKIGWFHLGAEMDKGNKSLETESFDQYPLQCLSEKSILMVGTVEPRKDYALALAAFEHLWQQGEKINFIIVGKPGWKNDQLINLLKEHSQKDIRLFWFENASDALLLKLYQSCQGLLMTSQCEGFGLPLIEAARHNLPILARDIPVFREVAKEYIRYFPFNVTAVEIAEIIKMWLIDINKENEPLSKNMPWLSWSQSMEQLTQVIIYDNWYTFIRPKNHTHS